MRDAQIIATFDWWRLALVWRGDADAKTLPPRKAIASACSHLDRIYGKYVVDAGGEALRFWCSWRTGRSWLSCVARGQILAEESTELTCVTVSGSIVPLIVLVVVFAGAAWAWFAWPLAVFFAVVLGGGNYPAVRSGMKRLAIAAQSVPGEDSRR
jgi:hypothetical protein